MQTDRSLKSACKLAVVSKKNRISASRQPQYSTLSAWEDRTSPTHWPGVVLIAHRAT